MLVIHEKGYRCSLSCKTSLFWEEIQQIHLTDSQATSRGSWWLFQVTPWCSLRLNMFWFYNWLLWRCPLTLNCRAQCHVDTIVENHPENKSEIKRKKEINAGDQATKSTTNTNPDVPRCSICNVFTKALLAELCVELLTHSSI